jgi:iron complex outermembrane receptor protein
MFPKDDTYQAVVNVPGQFDLDIMYLRSRFTWDVKDNLRFIYSLGMENQDRESAQDMEQSLNAWDQAMYFLPGTGSWSGMNEAQLQSQGNAKFNWIVGANFFYEKTETFGFFDNPMGEKSFWHQPDRSTTASAVFAQGTYSVSAKWHLTIGGRYSDETKEDKGGRTYKCLPTNGCAPNPGDTLVINGEPRFARDYLRSLPTDFFEDPSHYPEFDLNDNKGSWSHDDWRIGLDYQRNENMLLYGYLATGFKAGGIGDVFSAENVLRGGMTADPNGTPDILSDDVPVPGDVIPSITVRTDFEQEEVITFELGFKQRFLGGKLELRGAYFLSDYENLQLAAPSTFIYTEFWQALKDLNGDTLREDLADPIGVLDENDPIVRGWVGFPIGGGYATQNVPAAQIQGFELEYHWRPWVGGTIKGYASWLDTEITEDWITRWDYDCRSLFVGLGFNECNDPENPRLQVNLKGNDLAVSPPFKLHMTVDHAFLLQRQQATLVPWVTTHWEADSYLTIWNVDKHTDDMDFVILDQDIRYTDDKREAWSMVHAGVRWYSGDLMAELYAYNITDEVVQWWGGAAEQVPKGSMSMPLNYGFRIGYKF